VKLLSIVLKESVQAPWGLIKSGTKTEKQAAMTLFPRLSLVEYWPADRETPVYIPLHVLSLLCPEAPLSNK
jgi:hypothetical protein